MESILQGGKWAILAVFCAGCGQAVATAPVTVQPATNIVSTQPVDTAFVAENAIAQLPAGPSPRGWSVAFTGGPLNGQTRIVPRIYPTHSQTVGMAGGTYILEQYQVGVNITPAQSTVFLSVLNGGGGQIVVTPAATSFSGSGTLATPTGPVGFSAVVTEIP